MNIHSIQQVFVEIDDLPPCSKLPDIVEELKAPGKIIGKEGKEGEKEAAKLPESARLEYLNSEGQWVANQPGTVHFSVFRIVDCRSESFDSVRVTAVDGHEGGQSRRYVRIQVLTRKPKAKEVTELLEALSAKLNTEPCTNFSLLLSGGGLRATLFHLGVVAYLRKTGALDRLTEIYSVSGGSILAAHMVLNWEKYRSSDEKDFAKAAQEIIDISKSGIRSTILEKSFWPVLCELVMFIPRLLVRGLLSAISNADEGVNKNVEFKRSSPTRLLHKQYAKYLYDDNVLASLSDPQKFAPDIELLSTGLKTGTLCSFNGLGFSMHPGSETGRSPVQYEVGSYPVSKAVAASSAFPGLFPPVRVTGAIFKHAEGAENLDEFLSDGGIFDNLGCRKFMLSRKVKRTSCNMSMIQSDAGAPFRVEHRKQYLGFLGIFGRAPDILMRRVSDLESQIVDQEILQENAALEAGDGAKQQGQKQRIKRLKVSISDSVLSDGAITADYQKWLPQIRTDLDRFSDLEIFCLLRHGFKAAELNLAREFNLPPLEAWTPDCVSAEEEMVTRHEPSEDVLSNFLASSERTIVSREFPGVKNLSILCFLCVLPFLIIMGLSVKYKKQSEKIKTYQIRGDLSNSVLPTTMQSMYAPDFASISGIVSQVVENADFVTREKGRITIEYYQVDEEFEAQCTNLVNRLYNLYEGKRFDEHKDKIEKIVKKCNDQQGREIDEDICLNIYRFPNCKKLLYLNGTDDQEGGNFTFVLSAELDDLAVKIDMLSYGALEDKLGNPHYDFFYFQTPTCTINESNENIVEGEKKDIQQVEDPSIPMNTKGNKAGLVSGDSKSDDSKGGKSYVWPIRLQADRERFRQLKGVSVPTVLKGHVEVPFYGLKIADVTIKLSEVAIESESQPNLFAKVLSVLVFWK